MGLLLMRVRALVVKELFQALRDPRMRLLVVMPPLVQLVAFGYAANLDLKNIPAALYDEDRSSVSRELAFAFCASGYFRFVAHVSSPREMAALIDRGAVQAALHFPPGLAARVNGGKTGQVQVIVAGTNSNTASLVQSYTLQIIQQVNEKRLRERLDRNPTLRRVLPAGAEPIIRLEVRAWYNPNLSSRNFYVPAIIAMIIMVVTLTLTSMAIVREKEIGTMEQIMVTPIRPVEFILGKTIPFGLVGMGQVCLVTGVGVFWFGVPMRGNPLLLLCVLLVYLLCCLNIGLLISTISRTQQQALMSTYFFIFPAILLSGFIFPIANMPRVIQYVTYVNPLRYFLVIIRSIFLKGAGLDVWWPHLAALLAISLGVMALAVRRVSKTLD